MARMEPGVCGLCTTTLSLVRIRVLLLLLLLLLGVEIVGVVAVYF